MLTSTYNYLDILNKINKMYTNSIGTIILLPRRKLNYKDNILL